jgi:hypothetical protein
MTALKPRAHHAELTGELAGPIDQIRQREKHAPGTN